jgi:hypothetical protein
MLTFGVTNFLSKNLRLFFWETDNIPETDVLEEANYLSQLFDLDIYVLRSSKKGHHLVSFDVLTLKQVESIQNHTTLTGDYFTVYESALYNHPYVNTLRTGTKGKKNRPQFIKLFHNKKNKHGIAISHYRFYKALCNLPSPPTNRKHLNFSIQLASYNTGIGAKDTKKMVKAIMEGC